MKYAAEYGKDRLFADDPQKLKDELLNFGVKPSEVKVIVDITTDYGQELSAALMSDDDDRIVEMRNKLLQETEWRPEILSSILFDLFHVFSGRFCIELLDDASADLMKRANDQTIPPQSTVSKPAGVPGIATSSKKIDEGKKGNMTWEFYDDGLLVISGKGEATQSGTWEEFRKSIKKAVIQDGITSIGMFAFEDCTLMNEVRIASTVKSVEGAAFMHCSSLKILDIPEGVISIGDSAFDRCVSLTHVTIPRSMVSIGSFAFDECKKLKSVDLPAGIVDVDEDAFPDWTVINTY